MKKLPDNEIINNSRQDIKAESKRLQRKTASMHKPKLQASFEKQKKAITSLPNRRKQSYNGISQSSLRHEQETVLQSLEADPRISSFQSVYRPKDYFVTGSFNDF